MSDQRTASERMFESAAVAYGFACSEEPEPRGLRAAVRRVLDLQREEIAQAIEATIGGYPDNQVQRPKAERGLHLNDAQWAARIARDYGKEG